MSEKNNISEIEEKENIQPEAESVETAGGDRVVVKKKRFSKSDILVFGICLVVSLLVWLYATNLQKTAAEKEQNKVADAVESGINKTTEIATDATVE